MMSYSGQFKGDPNLSVAENAVNYIKGAITTGQIDPSLADINPNEAKVCGYSMFFGVPDIRDIYRAEIAGKVDNPLRPFLTLAIEWKGKGFEITKYHMKELIDMWGAEYYKKNAAGGMASSERIKPASRQIEDDKSALCRIFGINPDKTISPFEYEKLTGTA
jgi:hypothetical protein